MAHETIIPKAEITVNGEKLQVKIDHMLDVVDDESAYTGCYRITVGKYQIVHVEMDDDAIWIEKDKGPTELAKEVGKLIENYSE